MILTVTDIQPGDRHHLHCSDPRLTEELARVRRRGDPPVRPAATEPAALLADRRPTNTAKPAA